MTWLRRGSCIVSVLLLCACADDAANGEGTDAATDTNPTSTAPDPTSTATELPTSTGDDDPTTETPTTVEPTTMAPTTDAPTSSASTTGADTGDTNAGEDSTVLVSVDHGTSPPRLVTIVAQSATAERQCDLAPNAVYDALVFTRDDELLAHNVATDRLERIDPCDCGFQAVGPTDLGTVELTVDAEDGLLGLDLGLAAFVTVDPNTGLGNIIGPLGVAMDDGTIAWSDATNSAHVLDATGDQLWSIDTSTGTLSEPRPLATDITDPGMEALGDAQAMYVCAGTTLYTLDTDTGAIAAVGPLAFTGACTTLAAPRRAIACLEP